MADYKVAVGQKDILFACIILTSEATIRQNQAIH